MVNQGRPSASCFACRSRRIKCDRIKPSCTQCKRMSVQCPGYRDPLDQCFRDESERVVRRAQKSYKASAIRATQDKRPRAIHAEDGSGSSIHGTETKIPSSLSVSVEDVALCHFMLSYIPASHFDYLPLVYAHSASDAILPASVQAASIATLARKIGRDDVLNTARKSYAKALSETNASLADPVLAVKDATLISVLLLGLFEAIVWSGTRTPESWTTHTRGALALIKIRGAQQMESETGRNLFLQVANIVCVNSIQQKMRLPPELLELITFAMRYEDECPSPKYRLAFLTAEVSALLSDIDQGGMTATEIITTTRNLDDQYAAFSCSLHSPWQYQEFDSGPVTLEPYRRRWHVYPSHRAAQLWNTYRMTRILLNEIIHDYAICLESMSAEAVQAQAADHTQQMAEDICASIALFGKSSEPSEWCRTGVSMPGTTLSPTQTSLEASATSLLWPLSVVRRAELASMGVRTFAIEQLKRLGRDFHVPQAEKVAMGSVDISALQDGLYMFYVS
ncbi:hypothetical protein FB567DRAFT_525027 [Paraphoma chrysanthemicola]|uniref:Zn(2)-C6 fungal-type domain-containing protein n=1 Tax=Paraphoma chrysanthemicola TaxID=798071 RepID=A0A8K0VYP6_9PLEO|nr:hypothetical protein FB567DRAFT_525027 [Paraphoma chrysanthemicola]